MTNYPKFLAIISLLGAAGLGGYFLGQQTGHVSGEAAKSGGHGTSPSTKPGERKVLYYRNPMGLADTSPVPKIDPMGMNYIPVYADDDAKNPNMVKISADRIQKLGVRSEPVSRQVLKQTIRVTGVTQVDERRQKVIALKFDGWIEQLTASATGQTVRSGDTLMRVYSPAIMQTEREYLVARSLTQANDNTKRGADLADAAMQRLRNFSVPESEIKRMEREGTAAHNFAVPSSVAGVVLEKAVTQGQYFAAGDTLLRLADLSRLWIIGAIPEQDLPKVAIGQTANITLASDSGRIITGKVGFIYPDIDPATRTGRVRIDLSNPHGILKTGQYAAVDLASGASEAILAVSTSAILDDGTRQAVLIDHGDGHFEPRAVVTGRRNDDSVEIREGLVAGDKVVVSANFLIDAESNLQAALRGFGHKAASSAENKGKQP